MDGVPRGSNVAAHQHTHKPHETDAVEVLERARLRRTPGRLQLLQILLRAEHPLTHQDLLDRSGLSRVAVYRALASFREAGIVHRVDNGDRVWRFAACSCGHSVHCHPHFTCRLCGELECLSDISLSTIPVSLVHYRIEEQEVYLRGVCARCLGHERDHRANQAR